MPNAPHCNGVGQQPPRPQPVVVDGQVSTESAKPPPAFTVRLERPPKTPGRTTSASSSAKDAWRRARIGRTDLMNILTSISAIVSCDTEKLDSDHFLCNRRKHSCLSLHIVQPVTSDRGKILIHYDGVLSFASYESHSIILCLLKKIQLDRLFAGAESTIVRLILFGGDAHGPMALRRKRS